MKTIESLSEPPREPLFTRATGVDPFEGDGRGSGTPTDSDGDLDHPAKLKLSRIKVTDSKTFSLPDVDRELVESCLHLEDCETRVAEHHRSLFRARFAREIEHAAQNLDLVNRHVETVQRKVTELTNKLAKTYELVRMEQGGDENPPWSKVDLAVAIALGLFSLVLLGMSVNTLATYLIDSGMVMFVEQPAVAYLLSAVNVGMALILKVGSSWCRDDEARHRYFVWLWGIGLVSGGFWLVSFAIIFPNIGARGIDEIIASIGQENSLRDAVLETVFVASQLISEICISAALWIHLERMVREHTPAVVMALNPEHRAYLERLSEWKESLRAAVEKRASLTGQLKELRALETTFLSKASSFAKARLAARQADLYGLNGGSDKDPSTSTKGRNRDEKY